MTEGKGQRRSILYSLWFWLWFRFWFWFWLWFWFWFWLRLRFWFWLRLWLRVSLALPRAQAQAQALAQALAQRRGGWGGERDGRFAIENGLTAIMCERAIIAPAYSTPEARLSRNNDCRHNDCSNDDCFAGRIRAPTVSGRSRCLSAFRLSSRGLTTRLHTAHPYEVLNKEAYCWRTPP